MYVSKKAVLSFQIEGTQSSLSDLLLFENEEVPNTPLHDVRFPLQDIFHLWLLTLFISMS
ncbi:MAG: hypothetical protein H6757_00805 [Candidatus Omnitrophica bacterium]|nr:hypothetical protein [Candidatus Omnitrophota bacterium]